MVLKDARIENIKIVEDSTPFELDQFRVKRTYAWLGNCRHFLVR